MIAKGLNSITVNSTFSNSEANTLSLSGSARYKLPIMRVNIPSGESVQKLNIASGSNLKKVILNVNGTLSGSNLDMNEYLVENNTSLIPSFTGSGNINGRLIQDFDWPVGEYKMCNGLIGGIGGANGSDIAYQNPSLANGDPTIAFSAPRASYLLYRQSSLVFKLYFTYTRCDYATFSTAAGAVNPSSGVSDISGFFTPWLDSSGNFEQVGTNSNSYTSYVVPHTNGRDQRYNTYGTKVINNKRYVWFATNNKPFFYNANNNTFYQPGWLSRSATASNSFNTKIGLNDVQNGAPVNTAYDDSNFTGTISGDPNL